MEALFKISPLKLAIFIAINGNAAISYAQSCNGTPNPLSIDSACTNLKITQDKSSVNVNANVLATTLNDAIQITRASNSTTVDSLTIANGVYVIGDGNGNRSGITISTDASINTLTNNGVIDSVSGSGTSGIAVNNRNAYLGTLYNNGVIGTSSAFGLYLNGPVGSIINKGSIIGTSNDAINLVGSNTYVNSIKNSGSLFSASGYALNVSTGALMGELTNTAITGNATKGIYANGGVDIRNDGQIATLNNAQSALNIRGNLPTNYNIIINSSSSYGVLSSTSLNSGTNTNFGISPLSTVPSGTTTYTNVLLGFTSANLAARSGTFGGGIVTSLWSLNNSGTNWNLSTTLGTPIAPTIPSSRAATDQASAITLVLVLFKV